MIDALMILKPVDLDPHHTMGGRKSVLYAIKKDVGHPGILGRSLMSQEIDSRSDSVNISIEKLLSILPIFKEWSSAQAMI